MIRFEYEVKKTYVLQKQPPDVFYKKGVLKNFAKFTGKHLHQSLFFKKVSGRGQQLIRKETQVFPCEFCETLRATFLENTTRRLLLVLRS